MAKRAPEDQYVVLRKLRRAKKDSGFVNADNFVEITYIDNRGREQPMILVFKVALPLVLDYLGGPVYAPIVVGN